MITYNKVDPFITQSSILQISKRKQNTFYIPDRYSVLGIQQNTLRNLNSFMKLPVIAAKMLLTWALLHFLSYIIDGEIFYFIFLFKSCIHCLTNLQSHVRNACCTLKQSCEWLGQVLFGVTISELWLEHHERFLSPEWILMPRKSVSVEYLSYGG